MEEHRAEHRVLVHRTGEVTVESDLCTAGSLDPVERLNSARRRYQAHADATEYRYNVFTGATGNPAA